MPLICFASPKGGVGKSTLAANVAYELSKAGWRVLALDLDPQNALRLHFGMSLHDAGGFMHALPTQQNWRTVVVRTPSGVNVLPYGATDMKTALSVSHRVGDQPDLLGEPLADMLAQPGVVVVIDTEPGPSASLAAILPIVDLLVTILLVDSMSTALVPSIDSGRAYGVDWTKRGAAAGPSSQMFVLNQFDPRSRLGPVIAQGLSRHVGDRLLGLVHRDEHVAEAAAAQKFVVDYSPMAQASFDIRRIAQAISARLGAPTPATH